MNLYQHEDGYRYNSDSLLLYDFISKFSPKGNVLDVGSGCGIIGLLIKRDFQNIELTQIEVQKNHFLMNQKSAQENDLKVELINEDFLQYQSEKKFDFIISNPPFYDKGSKKSLNESLQISRYAQNLPISSFFKKVSSHMKPRGSFIFCYDAKQLDSVLNELHVNKFKVQALQFVHTKVDKISNLVLIHAKKSSKSLVEVLPALFIHDEEGNLSKNVQKIYEKSKTKSYIWN